MAETPTGWIKLGGFNILKVAIISFIYFSHSAGTL